MSTGRRFAEQEMYVLLSKILKNFRVEYNHGELDQKFQILMTPDRPATFTFIERDWNEMFVTRWPLKVTGSKLLLSSARIDLITLRAYRIRQIYVPN